MSLCSKYQTVLFCVGNKRERRRVKEREIEVIEGYIPQAQFYNLVSLEMGIVKEQKYFVQAFSNLSFHC